MPTIYARHNRAMFIGPPTSDALEVSHLQTRRVTADDLAVRQAERSAYRTIQARAAVLGLARHRCTRDVCDLPAIQASDVACTTAGHNTGCFWPLGFAARQRAAPARRSRWSRLMRELRRWLTSPRSGLLGID